MYLPQVTKYMTLQYDVMLLDWDDILGRAGYQYVLATFLSWCSVFDWHVYHVPSQNQPLKSLRKLLHLSSSSSNQPAPPDMHYQPLSNPASAQGGFTESRGHTGVSTPQLKSRQAAYGQLEPGWHTSALGRAEGNPYPEQMGIKGGQNGHGFGRPSRSRMPNLNDLKETALWCTSPFTCHSRLLCFPSVAPTPLQAHIHTHQNLGFTPCLQIGQRPFCLLF